MGRNILVVEDDRNISELIQMYLVKEGFDVRIAGDGGRAIDALFLYIVDVAQTLQEIMTAHICHILTECG